MQLWISNVNNILYIKFYSVGYTQQYQYIRKGNVQFMQMSWSAHINTHTKHTFFI